MSSFLSYCGFAQLGGFFPLALQPQATDEPDLEASLKANEKCQEGPQDKESHEETQIKDQDQVTGRVFSQTVLERDQE
jgi:hypothetical protein